MAYYVQFRPGAIEDVRGLDKVIADRILKKIRWLEENFENIMPEVLKADLKGLFKLRAGDYRILYSVHHKEQKIIVHLIGHRKEVYKQGGTHGKLS